VCEQSLASCGDTTSTAQQFRQLSRKMRSEGNISQTDPKPRLQFILDLQAWFSHKVEEKHEIILAIDANEDITAKEGKVCPLPYTLDTPIVSNDHDGSLARLMASCSLSDPLLMQHPDTPPPPTYSRGSTRIDYILLSRSLLPAVIRTGILPYDRIFISDHRACYTDLNAAFQGETPTIQRPHSRNLRLQDPRTVGKYLDILFNQIKYHKLDTKIMELHKLAENGQWAEHNRLQYESAYRLLTEIMLYAESQCSKSYSAKYCWSPTLKAAVKASQYGQLQLKQVRGLKVNEGLLKRLEQEFNIQPPTGIKYPQIFMAWKQSRETLKKLQQEHIQTSNDVGVPIA